jgi:hypothetical protein
MKKLMQNVDDDTVARAYNHFVEVFYPETTDNDKGRGLYFWKFLGMEITPRAGQYPGWALPIQAAYRCHLLAGPHWRTIAKLMTIKGHTHDVKCKTWMGIETEGIME